MKPEKEVYFQKALDEGYLARSAYKLLQIDEVFNLFEGVTRALDLCSAPGSWTQVIYNKLHNVLNNYTDTSKLNRNVKIVSVDLMPMNHFPGVVHLQADISQYSTMKAILEEFNDEKVDIVVCDGAIDVVGMYIVDCHMHHRIFLSALYITLNTLKTGGNFVLKIFINIGHERIMEKLKLFFKNVCIVRPQCSRNKEAFAVCQDYTPLANFNPVDLSPYVELKDVNFSNLTGLNKVLIPYLCGNIDDMSEIEELPTPNSRKVPEELQKILDFILKDVKDDIAILEENIAKTLPVYKITEDNQLVYDSETITSLFQGLGHFEKQNDEYNEKNSLLTQSKLDEYTRSEEKTQTQGNEEENNQNEEEINENNNEDGQNFEELSQSEGDISENNDSSSFSDEYDIEIQNPYANIERNGRNISEILKDKVKDLDLENRGKWSGFGFNLEDWSFFCKGTNIEDTDVFKSEEFTNIYKEFNDIEEELKKRKLNFSKINFPEDIIRKQEEIKKKIRTYFRDNND